MNILLTSFPSKRQYFSLEEFTLQLFTFIFGIDRLYSISTKTHRKKSAYYLLLPAGEVFSVFIFLSFFNGVQYTRTNFGSIQVGYPKVNEHTV